MLRSAKVSPLVVVGVAGVLGLILLLTLLQSNDTPSVVTHKFFSAVAKGDVDGAMAVSTFGGEPAEEVRKKWETCFHRTEYYRFYWKVNETFTPIPDEAIVAVNMYRGLDRESPDEKRYQVPLVKENGKWLVDAKSLNRDIFPALPR